MAKREATGKQMIKNHIKQSDSHNKAMEQQECWRQWERRRPLSPLGRTIQERLMKFSSDPAAVLGSMKSISQAKAKKAEAEKRRKRRSRSRSRSRSPSRSRRRAKVNKYLEREWESPPRLPQFTQHDDRLGKRSNLDGRQSDLDSTNSRETARRMKLDSLNKGDKRWGHDGFQDLYPAEYLEVQNKQKITERRMKRLRRNNSSGSESRSSYSTTSSSSRSSPDRSPPPKKKNCPATPLLTDPVQATLVQKRLRKSKASNGYAKSVADRLARIPSLMDIPISVDNQQRPAQLSATAPDRDKVQLRFKEPRRRRMALRAKLPDEEDGLRSEGARGGNRTTSAGGGVVAMTPGVVTMNTKITKSLRKAMKKKQREEKERRNEKSTETKEALAPSRTKRLLQDRLGSSVVRRPRIEVSSTRDVVCDDQVDQEVKEGDFLKIGPSYWDLDSDENQNGDVNIPAQNGISPDQPDQIRPLQPKKTQTKTLPPSKVKSVNLRRRSPSSSSGSSGSDSSSETGSETDSRRSSFSSSSGSRSRDSKPRRRDHRRRRRSRRRSRRRGRQRPSREDRRSSQTPSLIRRSRRRRSTSSSSSGSSSGASEVSRYSDFVRESYKEITKRKH